MSDHTRDLLEPDSQFHAFATNKELYRESNPSYNCFFEESDDRGQGSQQIFSPEDSQNSKHRSTSTIALGDRDDEDIFGVLCLSRDEEEKSIEKIESNEQDMPEYSEDESDGSSFTIASKKKSITKRRHRIIQNSSTNLNKNNFSNIVRFSVKMMMNYLCYEDCELIGQGISKNLFKNFIQKVIRTDICKEKSCRRVNLSTYFSSLRPEEQRMKEIFVKKFQKILRKQYLVQALKKGRMPKDKQLNYIRTKNKELLYFSNFLSSTNLF